MNAGVPDAGWYPDPAAPGRSRWWDGRSWTAHVREGAPPPPPAPGFEPRASRDPERDAFERMAQATAAIPTLAAGRVAPHSTAARPVTAPVAVARAPRRRTGLVLAVLGIGILGAGAALVALDPLDLAASTASLGTEFSRSVQGALLESVAQSEGVAVASVECPETLEEGQTGEFDCLVTLESGETISVRAHLESPGSTIVWTRAGH